MPEQAGTAAILNLEGLTRIVVTHRLEPVLLKQYDEILVLRDGRFLYTVMAVYYDPAAPRLTTGQCHFPPAMLVQPSEETREYYDRVIFSLNRAVTNAAEAAAPNLQAALEELRGVTW